MQPRTLAQIVAELNPTYQAQTQSLQAQQQLIPQEIASQETALNAQKDVAYEDIVSGARRRGIGFSGIPLGEQAKYAATQYAPALAGLRQQGQQKAMSLQDAILGINERRDTLGQQIYQQETDRAFQASEAEKNRRAQAAASRAASASPSMYQPQAQTAAARVVQSKPGSFAFYDAGNRPITAAVYAQQSGQELGDILYKMGSAGDIQARDIYNQLSQVANQPEVYQRALQMYTKIAPQLLGGL